MLEKFKLELILFLVGIFLIGCGILWVVSSKARSEGVQVLSSTEVNEAEGVDLVVDIAGAVRKPGIYQMASEARIGDIVVKAGGLSEEADHEWIAKNLNQAERLKDGQKIYIPVEGGVEKESGGGLGESRVNINTASQAELEGLNGIGPATAKKIIENRPYNNLDDLVEKKIMGQKGFESIVDQLGLW